MFAMLRLIAALLVAPLILQAQPRPRKVFISVDMEGISGVVQPAQLGPGGFEYSSAREWMTGEVNAAIAGIREAGPAEIVVCDSHGNGQNVLIDKLPEDVPHRPRLSAAARDDAGNRRLVRGGGVHRLPRQRVGRRRCPRPHDFERAAARRQIERDRSLGGDVATPPLAGEFGVPVAFVSGDRLAVTQVQQVAPSAEGAIVKEPYGYHSAMTVTPARGQAMIRDAAKRAMAQAGIAAAVPRQHADRARGRLQADDRRRARRLRPGLSRSDAHNVKGTFKDMIEISKLLQVVSSLEAP